MIIFIFKLAEEDCLLGIHTIGGMLLYVTWKPTLLWKKYGIFMTNAFGKNWKEVMPCQQRSIIMLFS